MPGKYGRLFTEIIRARDKCFERFVTSYVNFKGGSDSNEYTNDNVIAMLYALQKEVNTKARYHLVL